MKSMKTWIALQSVKIVIMSTVIGVAILTVAPSASALVDMNNAGYSNPWVDLEVPGTGYEMRALRAYKSRTLFNGMFGFGWCSEFETKLETIADGGIKISECGDGQEIYYYISEPNKKDVEATIKKIMAKMKEDKSSSGQSAEFFKKIEEQLVEDPDVRTKYSRQFGIAHPIKENTKYSANGKEVEHIILNKTFYTRNFQDGSSQRFDMNGRLTHNYDKNGNFVKFEYQKDLLVEVIDNNQRKLTFKYYPNKKVERVTGPNGLISEYKYDKNEDLVWNRNAWARKPTDVYTYEYNEFHNLTKATWPDKTFIAIKYDNVKDWVTSFTHRDKCVETYKYEVSAANPKYNYWSTSTKVCGKEVVGTNRYEFWHKLLPTGQVILSRIATNVNGTSRDVSYHDTFGKPTMIKVNRDKTEFEYYPDGLVKAKISDLFRQDFTYESKIKRVASVKTTYMNDKGKVMATKSTTFKYDEKGNLIFAENSDGQKITMTYDLKGRIQSIVDQAKKVVKIEYEDRFGKPSIVSRPGLGTIKVMYKPNGEIQKVDSKDGPVVASQVASTFNNLLDVISPATQELYL